MSKAIKKTTIALLSAATCFAAAVGIITASNVKASAEEVALPVAEGNFITQDGAEIRIAKDGSGIRWNVTVSDDFHQQAQAYAGIGGTVEYYTVVNDSAITENDHTNERAQSIKCTEENVSFNDKGVFTYRASIIYDQLSTELQEAAYNEVLYAQAYAKIIPAEGETKYVYSVKGDTERAIKGVAMDYLLKAAEGEVNPLVQQYQDNFLTYAGVESLPSVDLREEQKATKIESMYGEYTMEQVEGIWTKTFVGEGSVTTQGKLPAGNYDVYVGAKYVDSVNLTAEGKATAEIKGLGTSLFVAGNDYYASFVNVENGDTYRTPFRYATGVIAKAADMYLLKMTATIHRIDGYYIMKNMLTQVVMTMSDADLKMADGYGIWGSGGFRGTFDGNGYGWTGITMGNGSIFPVIATGGVIKNFSVVGTWSSFSKKTIVASMINKSKMENVYVSMVGNSLANPNISIIHSMVAKDTANIPEINNCVFKSEYTLTTDPNYQSQAVGMINEANTVAYLAGYSNYSYYLHCLKKSNEVYWVSSSMHVGKSASYRVLASNEETPEGVTANKWNAVTRYMNASEMATATKTLTELPAGFNPNLWTVDATYGLAWIDSLV